MLNAFSSKMDKFGFDLGLLILRVCSGAFMMTHGYQKMSNFPTLADQFPVIIGGSPAFNLTMAIFAEFFCAAAVALGLFTRLAVIPLIVTMAIAAFIAHGADPFQKKELALLYLSVFVALFFTGGGKYSLKRV